MEKQLSFGSQYLKFLMSLVDFSKVENILLLEGIVGRSDIPTHLRGKITSTVSLGEEPRTLVNHKEFDVAVIIPTFGRVRRNTIELPEGWKSKPAAAAHIEDSWLAWSIETAHKGAQIIAVTSQGMLNSTLRKPIREKVIHEGLSSVILLGPTHHPESSVNVAVLMIRRGYSQKKISLINLSQVPKDADWGALGKSIRSGKLEKNRVQGLWFTSVEINRLSKNVRLDPDFYHPRFLQIEPPPGHVEVLLSDIAEIRGGRSLASFQIESSTSNDTNIPFVQVSNITQDGKLFLEHARSFPKSLKGDSRSGWAQPGDILITVAGTLGKACIVPNNYRDGVFYDTSIRRIRVTSDVSAEIVYTSLLSDAVQLQIERYASGSVIPIVSTANLGSIRLFLPSLSDARPTARPQAVSPFHKLIAQTLQDNVVKPLLSDDNELSSEWRLETVAKLKKVIYQIQKDHEPLDELVTRNYPLPIALSYWRMVRAKHNSYEQVNRLVELYETLTYFFYYVLLSNYLRSPDLQDVQISKQHLNAYKSFSMDARLKFIKEFLLKVRQERLQIFMPELLDVDLYTPLDQIRSLRNTNAHSTSGTPAAQRARFDANWPPLEKLLQSLRFLRDYPLCRIDSFYSKNNKVIYRIEYFQGAMHETDIREQEAPKADDDSPKLVGADRDHVILLNPQFDWLDLHPFYQVTASSEYRYETHLCFHKQVSNGKLLGESIQFRTELSLDGSDDLQQLMSNMNL